MEPNFLPISIQIDRLESENLLQGSNPSLNRGRVIHILALGALIAASTVSFFVVATSFMFIRTSHRNEHLSQTFPRIPNECIPYIQAQDKKRLLNLYHGRYIYHPSSSPPYNSPCFMMKHRYNCMSPPNHTTDESLPHNWRFVLQSNHSDIRTQCDLTSIVDALGGPVALPRDRYIGLMGNSFLRQLFESLGCKYKHHLNELLLHQNGPDQNFNSLTERQNRPYELEEYGSAFLFDTEDSDKVCFAGFEKDDLQSFYSASLPETLKVVPNCTDNFALAKYNRINNKTAVGDNHTTEVSNAQGAPLSKTLSVFFNFRPHYLKHPNNIYKALLGYDVMQSIDTIFWNDQMQKQLKNKVDVPSTVQWIDLSNLLPTMRKIQERDAGVFFREDNPWIAANTVGVHPCMPGIPEDETAVLLFILLFDLDGIMNE